MNSSLEKLIQRVLAGEIDLNNREVIDACQDEEFALRLDDSLQVLAALDEESLLAEARGMASSAEGDLVATAVQREMGARSNGRGWLVPFVLSIAAASLLIVGILNQGETSQPVQSIPLGSKIFKCLAPIGSGADFYEFSWTNAAPGGSYEIEVYNLSGEVQEGGSSGALGDVRKWSAPKAFADSWGTDIEWRLTWTQPGGGQAKVQFAQASR